MNNYELLTNQTSLIYQYPFKYNIIYIFEAKQEQGEKYQGCLKIGMTSILRSADGKMPTQKELDDAAWKRIHEYTNTAGFILNLLYTTLAITNNGTSFSDYNVHQVLKRSGYNKADLGTHANEWFIVTLPVAINAIECVKEGKTCIGNHPTLPFVPIKLRTEQQEAIKKAFRAFKLPNKKCLWNCKMRFGKTITALELIKQSMTTLTPFKKILIATNRPSVSAEWSKDYRNFFPGLKLEFYSRKDENDLSKFKQNQSNSIVFISAQDLKGAKEVGGNYDKLHNVLATSWDLIIIDEAHEGWKSEKGQNVLDPLINSGNKNKPCVLYLSGTPFNIEQDFSKDETFTWTYLDEQRTKIEWNGKHPDETNPYQACPKMEIYTLNLDEITNHEFHNDNNEIYFNFAEFFKTDKLTHKFVYEGAVKAFLNKLHSNDTQIKYPFNNQFRDYFHHTLWLVPGVAEAKALVKLLNEDETFSAFKIVDVTGSEMESNEALEKVRIAIGSNPAKTWTITVTCQRLTVGATIPEWTAILYLAGTNVTSKIKYLQSIFRVQSACNNYAGMTKDKCYVFDFAPERTLRMIASECIEEVGDNAPSGEYKAKMEEWLQFMPVVSLTKAKMQLINTQQLFTAIEQVQANKIYESGFLDSSLFDLSKINDSTVNKIEKYSAIFKDDKILIKNSDVIVNDQGVKSTGNKVAPKQQTPEEKTKQKQRDKWRKLLQAVSSRLPLLIYGSCDPNLKDVIDVNNLVEHVDEESWQQFMPANFTKKEFNEDFAPFINSVKFNLAAHKLLNEVYESDQLPIGLRIVKLTSIINKFKNPDKETVLTPWWVVNMQLSSCFGGESFYELNGKPIYKIDDSTDFSQINQYDLTKKVTIVDVTSNLFKLTHNFLDINSKLGLYLLYFAYSLFVKAKQNQPTTNELDLWKQIIENNIYGLCKSKMAQSLTIKTLIGTKKNIHVNTCVPNDETIIWNENKCDEIAETILNPKTWGKNKPENMKFDAIVGNPPYGSLAKMEKNKGSKTVSIYPDFFKLAVNLNPNYISLIMPSRWMTCDANLEWFRDFTKQHNHFKILFQDENPKEIFPSTEIKGGICYFLWEKAYEGKEIKIIDLKMNNKGEFNAQCTVADKSLIFQDFIITDANKLSIKNKVWKDPKQLSMMDYVCGTNPYGIPTNFCEQYKNWSTKPLPNSYECLALNNSNRIYIYI